MSTYGSSINMIHDQTKNPAPAVGMGATHLMWSDRHAYTVIEVSTSGKRCVLQRDTATRTDKNGMSDAQDYAFTPDPNGHTRTVTLRSDGRWREVGAHKGSSTYAIGRRDEHYDFTR